MLGFSSHPVPSMFKMLLRDLVRGASSFAETTEGLVDPVLPDGVKQPLHSARIALGVQGSRILSRGVALDDIRGASACLRGDSTSLRDANRCAAVLAMAWDRTCPDGEGLGRFLSESVAVARLASFRNGTAGTPFDHAAGAFIALRRSRVAGSLPGLPVPQSDAETQVIDLRLFAFFAWLLAERASSVEEEMKVLELSMAVSRVFWDEVGSAIGSINELAGLLKRLSGHL